MHKSLKTSLKESENFARHCFSVLFFIAVSVHFMACDSENTPIPSVSATDDASLLKQQLEQLRTRSTDARIAMLIHTKINPVFQVTHSSDIVVDWGDGCRELNVFSHTYTDNLPAHTIIFQGREEAITRLVCNDQELIFLDVTANSLLTYLNCWENRLTTLNLSKNKKLDSLQCHLNKLSEIDITNNPELEYFDCRKNDIKKLDLSGNVKLKNLACSNLMLDSIDLSANVLLTDVWCSYNNLKKIDVSKNLALKSLTCSYNLLTTLDFSANRNFEVLVCRNNQLTNLYISKNTRLKFLDCRYNQLEILLIPANAWDLDNIICRGNPFEKDPQRLKILADLLVDQRNGTSLYILDLSPDADTTSINYIESEKNWWITTDWWVD